MQIKKKVRKENAMKKIHSLLACLVEIFNIIFLLWVRYWIFLFVPCLTDG